MKKRFFGLFCALALLLSLISCAADVLKPDGADYVHSQSGVSYRFASANYAAEPSGDAVAQLKRPVSGEEALFALEGRKDKKFLATAAGRVLYDVSTPLPTLEELPVSHAGLYSLSMNMAMTVRVTDAALLEDVKYLCTAVAAFDADQIAPSVKKTAYEMRLFAKEAYAGIYYRMQFWRCDTDVLIYAEYTDEAAAKALYPSVDYTLVTEEGVTYACYNFGNALFYDPVSGQCRAAEDAFASEFSSEV